MEALLWYAGLLFVFLIALVVGLIIDIESH